MSELALHLTTRLNMIPMAWDQASTEATNLIAYATRRAGPDHVFRIGNEGVALTMSMLPTYKFILRIHSALFETHAASELMRNFLARARRHIGLPRSPSLKQEFKDAIASEGGDNSWCDALEDARGFFSHEGTAYVAIDISTRSRDILLMKRNLHEFDDESAFLRYSELAEIETGFRRSKPALRRYLAQLYASA
jgi:hypothetical protein